MSDARAIEAVTQTLRWLIGRGLDNKQNPARYPGVHVGATPPDQAANSSHPVELNLFLYQASVDGALRNQQAPTPVPGESAEPPLPLVLRYLLTPYVRHGDDVDVTAHHVLGLAVQTLNDHAVLTRPELADVAPCGDVSDQVERIRISWLPLEEKDIYSLWSIFSSPYRLSVAFEVRAVLIDSRRRPRTPLPVLTRGINDSGPVANANIDAPFPELTAAVAPNSQPSALLGDTVTLRGANLDASAVRVLLDRPGLADPIPVAPTNNNATEVVFTVPNTLPAGAVSVAIGLTATGLPEIMTNAVSLPLAPKITTQLPTSVAGTGKLVITCEPPVRPGQQALLLLAEHGVAADAFTATTASLTFEPRNVPTGAYLTRLRVDGVDSQLVDRTVTPPVFDRTQLVTVT
jgi:hypothetical protein